ncbi:MAG: tetraacyldisaccharide 4'-kinase [Planctomycetota bacterium]|jgi:tetraacyldisaccharide 4'-kinase
MSHDTGSGLMGWPAAPLAALYRLAVAMRNGAFDRGWRAVHDAGVPVIAVGNLTVGGTGKTPAVEWLVLECVARGRTPAVLLRGYGATAVSADGATGSDETIQHAENLAGVAVIANPDRVAGAQQAVAGGADVCVCDDAFQHRRIKRDLDIVCIDATNPWGGGHCLPWGRLREPAANLRRAHAVLITRSDRLAPAALDALRGECRALLGDGPILATTHAPIEVIDRKHPHPLTALQGEKVFVISGVGNPAAVRATVEQCGATVVGGRAWGDHHAWTASDLAVADEAARLAGADAIVTTQKDWVKLRAFTPVDTPLRAVRIGLQFVDDPAPLGALLDSLLGRPGS